MRRRKILLSSIGFILVFLIFFGVFAFNYIINSPRTALYLISYSIGKGDVESFKELVDIESVSLQIIDHRTKRQEEFSFLQEIMKKRREEFRRIFEGSMLNEVRNHVFGDEFHYSLRKAFTVPITYKNGNAHAKAYSYAHKKYFYVILSKDHGYWRVIGFDFKDWETDPFLTPESLQLEERIKQRWREMEIEKKLKEEKGILSLKV